MSRYEYDTNTAAADEPTGPGDETFWQSYNRNLEFPIASLMSILAHVAIVAVLVGMLLLLMAGGKDKTSVPIVLVQDNGKDAAGAGNPFDGGPTDPIAIGEAAPTPADLQSLPNNETIPEIQQEIKNQLKLQDDLANVTVTEEKAAAYAGLDKTVRDKLLPVGQKRGAGGAGPAGPGGTGADATRARSLRWVLRFRHTNGRDYLNQLASLGALVIVPIPPANSDAYVFRDLVNPTVGPRVSDDEWKKLAQQIQFCDFKQESVREVSEVLGVSSVRPHCFWAFFPPELEAKLADLERRYQGRESKDIEETIFAVTAQNGKNELTVVRQTLKR